MVIYKELHLTKDQFGEDFVTTEQIKEFVNNIEELYAPTKLSLFNNYNMPSEYNGYKFTQPIYVAMNYVTIFELILLNEWRYCNTYWMDDHKVLTFVKDEK